jgi:hypothetical protein
LWFIEYGANKIGRITTSGTTTEYPVPTSLSFLWGITTGPDGAVWFTEFNGNNVGRITPDGTISEYAGASFSYPSGIDLGPDGALWFAAGGGESVRLSLPGDGNRNAVKTIGTNPAGLTITVDGTDYIAPQTFTWPIGSQHTIKVASTSSAGGAQYSFANWSDMQPQSHTIRAAAGPNVYIANYIRGYNVRRPAPYPR